MTDGSTVTDAGFTITRTFAAPRELVWEVWTKPEHFSVWFGTDEVDVPLDELSLDVRVGGGLRAAMHLPDGNVIRWEGEYTEVERPSRLAFTLTDEPGVDPGMPITVDFADVGDATEITIFQARHGFSDEQVQLTIDGYQSFYDSMEKLLESLR